MSEFKVGDKVKCVDDTYTSLEPGYIYTVGAVNSAYVTLKGRTDDRYHVDRFEKADPSLEDELEVVQKQLVVVEDSVHSLEQRIKALQQAIKERDKPKGMIKVGDKIPLQSFLVCASGDVRPHLKNSWSASNVAMGNLFYDRESAEQYVHDRKQAVLRGDVEYIGGHDA